MELNNESMGGLEQLEQEIDRLLHESQDRFFTEYLLGLQKRVRMQQSQADTLRNEFERNYNIYLKRTQGAQESAAKEAVFQEAPSQYTVPWVEESHSCKWDGDTYQQKKKSDTEFIVGASILGVIGGIFILAALVMFGMNYMNGFVKGMCLYAFCGAVLFVSELLVYKRVKKLGCILTSVAVGGLYLSTAVNFISLKNFGMWQALVITAVISVLALFFGRRHDSSIYKVLGILAGYSCFLMIEDGISGAEFLAISAIILILNLVYAFVQVKSKQALTDVIHMIATAVFSLIYGIRAGYCHVNAGAIMVYVVCSTIVIHSVFIMRIKNHKAEAESLAQRGLIPGNNGGIITAYAVSTVFYSIIVNGCLIGIESESELYNYMLPIISGRTMTILAICVIGLVAFAVLSAMKAPEKWWVYCYICFMVLSSDLSGISDLFDTKGIEMAVCLVILLVISKLLSFRGNIYVKVCDAVLSFFICLFLLLTEGAVSYIFLGGVLFGILCISKWCTYHEILLTMTLTACTAAHMPSLFKLPAVVGILFVGLLAFNHFERMHDRYLVVFNVFALGVQVVCYLLLINPVYRNAYFTYLCMLVFGAATIVLIFQKRYHMDFKIKSLVLAIFLTYMGFIFKSSEPIMNSIILMVVALVCVGTGFANRQKFLRIYGLSMALMICGKMVLYDFMNEAILQRIILFFAVGVIALIIAGIYIILEKKSSTTE